MDLNRAQSNGRQSNGDVTENGDEVIDYDTLAMSLLGWIEGKISLLSAKDIANTLEEVQQQLLEFNRYRRQEKPPRFVEKGKLESKLYTSRAGCSSPVGRHILNINMAWGKLEKCEHDREVALRGELMRQEKLELLASTFDKKFPMRESWLMQNRSIVSDENFNCSSIDGVEAATKKLNDLEAYVLTYEGRIDNVVSMADELARENFHDAERIQLYKGRIVRLWGGLQDMINKKKSGLARCMALSKFLQDISDIIDKINEIKVTLLSEDYGKNHIQEQSIVEGEISVQGHRVDVIKKKSEKFLDLDDKDKLKVNEAHTKQKVSELVRVFSELVQLSDARFIKQDANHS